MRERSAHEAKKVYRKHLSDGDTRLVNEDYSGAINYYSMASIMTWEGLTNSYKCRNHVKLAKAYLGRANLSPNDSQTDFCKARMYAEKAIEFHPESTKAHCVAAKAAFSLNFLTRATNLCEGGLKLSPDNEELKDLLEQIKLRESDKDVAFAIEDRGVILGRALYEDYTQLKPRLTDKNVLLWPVLLRFMYDGDFCGYHTLESVSEKKTISSLVKMFFPEYVASLPAGQKKVYTRAEVELYYLVHAITLSGKADDTVENTDNDIGKGYEFAPVDKSMTLKDVLLQEDFVVTGIPAFYVTLKPGHPSDFFK